MKITTVVNIMCNKKKIKIIVHFWQNFHFLNTLSYQQIPKNGCSYHEIEKF